MELNLLEKIAIFILLRRHESELDIRLLKLMNKIEKELYQHLSIQEIEKIEDYYQETI